MRGRGIGYLIRGQLKKDNSTFSSMGESQFNPTVNLPQFSNSKDVSGPGGELALSQGLSMGLFLQQTRALTVGRPFLLKRGIRILTKILCQQCVLEVVRKIIREGKRKH